MRAHMDALRRSDRTAVCFYAHGRLHAAVITACAERRQFNVTSVVIFRAGRGTRRWRAR